LANEKVFIFDEENIKINVYEESRTDVHLINDNPSIEVVRIYEPGPQGAKGNDGGEFVLPNNVISSSNQIASDISGSFTVVSESLSQRINFFENKTLISGSDQLSSAFELRGNNIVSASNQLTSSYDLRYELRGSGILSSSNGFISSSQQIKDNLPDGIVSSSNQLSSVFEAKGSNLLSSSQQIATEISGAFGQASSSFQSRISTVENKTLVSGSQQIKNLLPTGVISGSEQLTSSYDNRYHRLGTGLFSASQQVNYGLLSNVPVGIVSGSDQISSSYDLKYEIRGRGIISSSNGFISSSAQVDYTFIQNKPTAILSASYALTASYVSGSSNSSISSSYSVSSSYAVSASYAPQAALPSGLISSSQQVNFADISGSFSTGSFLPNSFTSSYYTFTASIDTKVQRLENATSSYALNTEISGAFANVSSSLQARIGVFEGKTLFSSSAQLPSGTVSSSQQINSGSFSGSFTGNGGNLTGVVSSSYAISASYAPSQPSISSSYAVTASYAMNGGVSNIQTIGIRIKTEDTYITEGSKGFRHIGYNSNITKLRSIANIAGTINLNVKRDGTLLGNYNLNNASSSIDTTLTGWTTSLNSNDLIEFSVSQSSIYITDITFFMDLQSI
jgi:hypothetical protein